jgi:hypothetical protein
MKRETRRFPVNKTYILRLRDQERDELAAVVEKPKWTSQRKCGVGSSCPRGMWTD